MRIFKTVPQFDIMGKKKIAFIISAVLLVASLVAIVTKGVTYGIDFRGGTLIQVKFQETPDLSKVRKLFKQKLKSTVNISTFGEEGHNEVMITLSQEAVANQAGELQKLIKEVLQSDFPGYDIRRVETVGPKVGGELKTNAFQAALYALAGILVYIGIRFKFRFGVAAVVALFHDVTITMGIFVLLEKEFTLTIVAALLTIIGYSLNDTIVVFDRVRENIARMPRKGVESVVNISINESMSRTILTSVTTFIVVLVLFLFGGDIIHDFSFAMLIGLVVGTYSSIFVASPVVIMMDPAARAKKKD
ncbi:MAG: protein translocase subunit SecF [SAR324 cluster bacterium]|uniref:Protein-export membrane protein SecF n=1 Tax=SAR324 cluster bacterium TaxID=2024889 RepID=A0A2A4T1F5_9DELT|nr:MAG: protein translocase subunit SecF [SAR324 cluster bacterium]